MEPFIYLERYRVPIYRSQISKKCKFACVSNKVPTHLQTRHRDLSPAERRRVARIIEEIPGIIKDQSGLDEFQFPTPNTTKVPFLAPPKPDGLKCRKCTLPHLPALAEPAKPGRPRKIGCKLDDELPWREGVLCQRFFLSRKASGWFEVGRKIAGHAQKGKQTETVIDNPPAHSRLNPQTRAHLHEVLEREQKYQDDEKQPRVYGKALGDGSFAGTSLWLERTRWQIIYKNVRRDILQAMTRIPASPGISTNSSSDFVLGQGPYEGDGDIISSRQDEQKISCVLNAVDLMLDRCELTVQNTCRLLLCWLVSASPTSYQPKPFALMAKPNTRKKYRLLWRRFIAFILRGYLMPAATREQELRIRLSPYIMQQLECLWEYRVWEYPDTSQGKWPKMSETYDENYSSYYLGFQKKQSTTSNREEISRCNSRSVMADISSTNGFEDSDTDYEF
ncbi:hypothetical protein EDB80DRAFT_748699 [Ilyonectria destructans]|nr:hypothetical protein EDB80DRAFT_748699 [Ilyonectria destructans]